jgi:flagellar assembly factor FliW
MMNILTKYHENVDINEEDIITFPQGIPGFQDEKEFVILPLTDDGNYQVLQSVNTSYVAFVITSPFLLRQDYEFDLDENTIQQLEINKPDDVVVYSVLTVKDPFKNTTINLVAPIVINTVNKKGKQVILQNKSYTYNAPLMPLVEVQKG